MSADLRTYAKIARRVLRELSLRDREILRRYYLEEQSIDRICAEMSVSGSELRIIRRKARRRFLQLLSREHLESG